MCESGLHASENILDALRYAPGHYLRRVECYGEIVLGDDKLVCRHRKVLAEANMEQLLHEFACRCAERALRASNVTDTRCLSAIEAKRAWLRGDIGRRELAAARNAALAAARNAALAAARNATLDAARYATLDAALDAAWYAALDAARNAALDAAWYAAWAAAWDTAWDTALDTAWDTAWDTERQWQAEELERMFWEIAKGERK